MASADVGGPLQRAISGMVALWAEGKYWELTLYMDLWNNEIVGYGPSSRKGDRSTYFEGLQRAPSPISCHAFDAAGRHADRQRRHGIHKRMVESRALRRFRHSPLRRRADVRRAVHTVLQRGEAVVRIGLYDPEGLQGGGRERRNRPQEAKQGQIREKAKDDRRGEKQKEMIKVSTKR